MDEIVGLAPSGSLGSGFDLPAFKRALAEKPHFIGQDAGSTDMGPYYHGSSKPFLPRATYKHDLSIMLRAARAQKIPLIVGSALTSGSRETLEQAVDIIREIAKEEGMSFRMAIVDAELDKADLKRRIPIGGIQDIGPQQALTSEIVDRCGPICAQMGVEPLIKALDAGAEVVIAGRACDDAVFAALPILKGFDRGLSLHLGKILECAGISAVPCDLAEPMVGRLRRDHFIVRPGSEHLRCTTVSVAAHSLYERSDPCIQTGPGGVNDLMDAVFQQDDERTVRVSGSRFVPAPYMVKLEGAEFIGYRSIVLVGVRDTTMIAQIEGLAEQARGRAAERFSQWTLGADYTIDFHFYGKNAVMRKLEPVKDATPHEIGILINVVANSQELANGVAMYVRGTLQHIGFPGIVNTAGNLAYPFSPFNVPVGPAYKFSVYHLLPLSDPCEIFPISVAEVRN
ncbi:acyclic terpene utilization AtuA family protein [Bradyrhizobium diazoefficiens]|nr:acyclic terpene utilization AtuA family protein [Bradyrhizobium diazoefficiens]QQO23700.1 acyclic terpene utilization AtuA family protein [Bradyrhizobium diazoefficiens]